MKKLQSNDKFEFKVITKTKPRRRNEETKWKEVEIHHNFIIDKNLFDSLWRAAVLPQMKSMEWGFV